MHRRLEDHLWENIAWSDESWWSRFSTIQSSSDPYVDMSLSKILSPVVCSVWQWVQSIYCTMLFAILLCVNKSRLLLIVKWHRRNLFKNPLWASIPVTVWTPQLVLVLLSAIWAPTFTVTATAAPAYNTGVFFPETPDLSPVEHGGDVVEHVLLTNLHKWCDAAVSTWSRVSEENLQPLVESMLQRAEALLRKCHGGPSQWGVSNKVLDVTWHSW